MSLYAYSQFAQLLEETLLPVYSQRGYLLAKFSDIAAQPDDASNKKCPNGVNVSIPVEEGAAYKLGKFEWIGNQTLEMETMQGLFGMKSGSTADGAKITKGLKWTDDAKVTTFQAEIKSGTEIKNLMFTSRGDFVKEVGKE